MDSKIIHEESTSESSNELIATQTMVLRCQKKLASKFSSKYLVKFLMNEPTNRIFDNVHILLYHYTNSRQLANKQMKNMIKLNVKITLLFINDVFNDEEIEKSNDFRDVFYKICELIIKTRRCRNHTILINLLLENLNKAKSILLLVIHRHLTDKSKCKIINCAEFLVTREFLAKSLSNNEPFKTIMDRICVDLQDIMDRGLL